MLQPRSVTWRRQIAAPGPPAPPPPSADDAADRAAPDSAAGTPPAAHASPFAAANACPAAAGNRPTTTLLTLAWRRYQQQLRRRPLATKAVTSACVAALSDVLAQAIGAAAAARRTRAGGARTAAARGGGGAVAASSLKAPPRYDLARTLKFALLGLVWSGPSAHHWQAFLQRALPPPPPADEAGTPGHQARALTAALAKVAVDQLTYGPVCNLMFMTYTTLVVGGGTLADLTARVRRDFITVQKNGWRVWPLAGLINYRFVPLEYRVLCINLAAFLWTTYLNLKAA
jgi:peroxisomal membrane protein 2